MKATAVLLAQITNEMPVTWQAVGFVGSAIGCTAWLTWFFSEQQRKMRKLLYHIISLHNREDDDRFEAHSNDIWGVREYLAARDGAKLPARKTFPRRRYLAESMDEDGNMRDGG